jgi:iron(III) transport system ATP-binding protein
VSRSEAISAADVVKTFAATRAVDGCSLTLEHGTIAALLGPSGSGKTTLLRVIAGFEVPDSGTIEIGGRTVVGDRIWVEPERRRIGMVFQDGALFPHLDIAANVAFGRPRPGRVEECLELVGLADRARAFPHELSGGERQRVALARALATDPEVILLDEPFASLDAGMRVTLREEVAGILRTAGASALLVTHDQEEALSLADVVTVMRAGRIEQTATPEELYNHPASRWAAEFLGAANVLPGSASDGRARCELGSRPVDPALRGDVDIVVRPEAVVVGELDGIDGPDDAVKARITGRAYFGHDLLLRIELPSGLAIHSRGPGHVPWHRGDDVRVWIDGPTTVLDATAEAPDGPAQRHGVAS